MAIARVTTKVRQALAAGAGFGVARRLFRGLSIDSIVRWLTNAFGTMQERELLSLVDHGRAMRDAGVRLTDLTPGAMLDLNNIPVNPFLSSTITQGARVVSELIVPWQTISGEDFGEWFWRIQSAAEPTFDDFTSVIDTIVVDAVVQSDPTITDRLAVGQIVTGSFLGISSVRVF